MVRSNQNEFTKQKNFNFYKNQKITYTLGGKTKYINLRISKLTHDKNLLYPCSSTIVFFSSCGEKNDLNPSLKLKYEISTNSFFLIPAGNTPSITVSYTNEKGETIFEQIHSNSNTWSKIVNVSSSDRPFEFSFTANGTTRTVNGIVVLKVSANDITKSESQVNIFDTQIGMGGFQAQTSGLIID
ncbi:hypothetical protein SAMN06295967_10621 [Belliella buryatensis]|uniref:Uncharacterized protein n=1 Tax=Belliella buryatensis TaxID=1500549 RepID=A0A239CY74_9BACT|nr:hypothetical protein [Belliella buryatensis]SNS25165.1 hypothetical protein SAMN06295967_10621 [Belliella buryatensis]